MGRMVDSNGNVLFNIFSLGIIYKKGVKLMTYRQLVLTKGLLESIRDGDGEGFTIDNDERVDNDEVINYLSNLILDIDKAKIKSNNDIMTYQMRIEVNK
jgi:hypothetical protein